MSLANDGLAVSRALAKSGGLRSSILAAAFSGELVPQDHSDEPASYCLSVCARSVIAQRPQAVKAPSASAARRSTT